MIQTQDDTHASLPFRALDQCVVTLVSLASATFRLHWDGEEESSGDMLIEPMRSSSHMSTGITMNEFILCRILLAICIVAKALPLRVESETNTSFTL